MSIEFLTFWAIGIYYLSVVLYVCLDGFGIGLGCLHIFARNDDEKRVFLNAVGPVWDGNAVWIVITTGILLAAFTKVFTSLLSGFYLPIMGIIFGFMIRSAAIEFRSKNDSKVWRHTWDFVFWIASLLLALDFGIILGHTIQGVPIDATGVIAPHSFRFFSIYPLIVGFFSLFLFSVHGGMYALNKTEGALAKYVKRIVLALYPLLIISWIILTIATFTQHIHMLDIFTMYPAMFSLIFVATATLLGLPYLVLKKRFTAAFFVSCLLIFSFVTIYASGMYPYFAVSSLDKAFSLSIFNCANSYLSLFVVFVVSVCGIPLSFFYFSYVYKVFRGVVKINQTSY